MEPWLFALIASPLSLTATLFNFTFLFCLMRPVEGVTLRNPLRFLLIIVLLNSTCLQLVIGLSIVMLVFKSPFWLQTVTRASIYQFFCGNFTCNAWISIFYYMSIVPQHHPILVWIKRNIRAVLYVGFTVNQIILVFSLSMGAVTYLLLGPVALNQTSLNSSNSNSFASELYLFHFANFSYLLYCTCPLVTLVVSWGRTFLYLREHMKKMGQNSESFSQPQQKSQMRVTVTGMVQAGFFLPSSLWTVAAAILYLTDLFEIVDPNRFITMTFCSAASLGNLLCFGFSQSVFRQGILSAFKKRKT